MFASFSVTVVVSVTAITLLLIPPQKLGPQLIQMVILPAVFRSPWIFAAAIFTPAGCREGSDDTSLDSGSTTISGVPAAVRSVVGRIAVTISYEALHAEREIMAITCCSSASTLNRPPHRKPLQLQKISPRCIAAHTRGLRGLDTNATALCT